MRSQRSRVTGREGDRGGAFLHCRGEDQGIGQEGTKRRREGGRKGGRERVVGVCFYSVGEREGIVWKVTKGRREGERERVVGFFNSVGEREGIGWEGTCTKRRREG